MDFSLSEEQHLLVSTIRGFIESELRPLEEDIEKTGRLADDLASEIRAKSQELGLYACLLYTSPSPRDRSISRMPSSA